MISRRRLLGQSGVAALALALPLSARADVSAVYAQDGLALGGVDPVAYFTHGGPVPGDRAIELMWRGTMWRFISAAHRDRFEMDPVGHAPCYGCYCAYGMAQGRLLASDPAAFALHQGLLYVFSEPAAREMWLSDIAANLASADRHWPELTG